MLIGYARISKTDGSQVLDLQKDALSEAGVGTDAVYNESYPVTPLIVARMSPYKIEHINRFGRYQPRFDQVPPPITEVLRLSPAPRDNVSTC